MTDELNKKVGDKEPTKLLPGSVIVKTIAVEPPKEGSKAKMVILSCKHPDKEQLIKLSAINVKKVQNNSITIKKETLWYNEDEDGNIRKGSAVATLLSFYKMANLKAFENAAITTEADASGYLVIKAY